MGGRGWRPSRKSGRTTSGYVDTRRKRSEDAVEHAPKSDMLLTTRSKRQVADSEEGVPRLRFGPRQTWRCGGFRGAFVKWLMHAWLTAWLKGPRLPQKCTCGSS